MLGDWAARAGENVVKEYEGISNFNKFSLPEVPKSH
jgi:hypothetical protein